MPAVHATHAPLLQTRLVPQVVPSAMLPFTLHTIDPVEHEYVPVWHELGEHVPPAVHDTQLPPLQTMFTPQLVPSPTLLEKAHCWVPEAQE